MPSDFWEYGKKSIIQILIPPNSRELEIKSDCYSADEDISAR